VDVDTFMVVFVVMMARSMSVVLPAFGCTDVQTSQVKLEERKGDDGEGVIHVVRGARISILIIGTA
jgi:hypothetical protein